MSTIQVLPKKAPVIRLTTVPELPSSIPVANNRLFVVQRQASPPPRPQHHQQIDETCIDKCLAVMVFGMAFLILYCIGYLIVCSKLTNNCL